MNLADRIVIVGVNGGFGRNLAAKLGASCEELWGIDLADEAADAATVTKYARTGTDAAREMIAEADLVLLCIPERAVIDAMPTLAKLVRPEALIVDIASVKSRIAERVASSGVASEYVSVHPMFGPRESWAGQNVAAVSLRSGRRGDAFVAMLRDWGAHVTALTASEHDKACAWLQAGAHASLLAWGAAAEHAGVPVPTLLAMATPIDRAMLTAIARILDGGRSVYYDIQRDNGDAAAMRSSVAGIFAELGRAIDAGDRAAFERVFERLDAMFGDRT